jgi:Kef-type K+ transport system membrane component KefB
MSPDGFMATRWLAILAHPPEALFVITAMLVAGALAGEFIARTTRLPRLVGYTAAGCVAAAVGLGAPQPLSGAARVLVDLAMALLLFEIGSRVHLRWLRPQPRPAGHQPARPCGTGRGGRAAGADQSPATAATCAILAMPASAAGRARGAGTRRRRQVTQRMALLTAMNTLYAVLALSVLRLWWVTGQEPHVLAALTVLAQSFFGSLLLAAVLAAAVALAARRLGLRDENAVLLLLGLVVLAVMAARWLQLSTLLVPLLAGLLLRNTTERPWVWPRHFGTAGGVLVLMLFIIVGASWSPQVLVAGGIAALALVAARGLGKAAAVLVLSRWSRCSLRQGLALSITLTPLSATALVMLSDLMQAAPQLAGTAAPIVLTSIALLELVGPIAVQLALRFAGEVGDSPRRRRQES